MPCMPHAMAVRTAPPESRTRSGHTIVCNHRGVLHNQCRPPGIWGHWHWAEPELVRGHGACAQQQHPTLGLALYPRGGSAPLKGEHWRLGPRDRALTSSYWPAVERRWRWRLRLVDSLSSAWDLLALGAEALMSGSPRPCAGRLSEGSDVTQDLGWLFQKLLAIGLG